MPVFFCPSRTKSIHRHRSILHWYDFIWNQMVTIFNWKLYTKKLLWEPMFFSAAWHLKSVLGTVLKSWPTLVCIIRDLLCLNTTSGSHEPRISANMQPTGFSPQHGPTQLLSRWGRGVKQFYTRKVPSLNFSMMRADAKTYNKISIVWQGSLIVFSGNGYQGTQASASNLFPTCFAILLQHFILKHYVLCRKSWKSTCGRIWIFLSCCL